MSKINRKYGHLKHVHDPTDPKIKFTVNHVKVLGLSVQPTELDLSKKYKVPQALSEIDQGSLGSCTGNATSYALAVDEIKQSNKMVFLPSRLFIYYNARKIEGTIDEDAGAQIKDVIKGVYTYGACDEHHWIYDPTKFTEEPPQTIYTEAKNFKPVKYACLDFSADITPTDRINHIKRTLQSGYPIVFGFTVYDSFESDEVAKTGMMPMPKEGEQIVGGHAVCCIGYSDSKKCMIVKNSWGADWGINSYFYMPYAFISDPNMVDDFWVIQSVSNPTDVPHWSKVDINPDAINLQAVTDNGGVVNSQ
jgi:C1A family cysteine protease